jgi:hypothetical protein
MDVLSGLRAPRGPDAYTWLCRESRGRDGGIRKELAAGVNAQENPHTLTCILGVSRGPPSQWHSGGVLVCRPAI